MNRRFFNVRSEFRISLLVILMLVVHNTALAQKGPIMIIRISEIEIYPQHLEEYNRILQEESRASVKLEPGVVAIFPMSQETNPTQIRILEIYSSHEAYESHLQTPHFQKYKAETLKMVKSLKLVDMKAIDSEAMQLIFKKLKVGDASMRSSKIGGDVNQAVNKEERYR